MIDAYDFGRIVVNGKEHTNDLLIYNGEVREWWRKQGHNVAVEDVEDAADKKPDKIIFGTGKPGHMNVPEGTQRFLEKKGIQTVVRPTPEAVKIFNNSDQSKTMALLHLTC